MPHTLDEVSNYVDSMIAELEQITELEWKREALNEGTREGVTFYARLSPDKIFAISIAAERKPNGEDNREWNMMGVLCLRIDPKTGFPIGATDGHFTSFHNHRMDVLRLAVEIPGPDMLEVSRKLKNAFEVPTRPNARPAASARAKTVRRQFP